MPKKLPKSTEKSDNLPIKLRQKRVTIDHNQLGNDPDATSEAKSEEKYEDVKSRVNIFHLHSDVWRSIFPYLSDGDVLNLSATSEHFQKIVRETKSEFNLSINYRLDVKYFLNHVLSAKCTSIDVKYCWWLTPNTIIEIIAKTNLRHLHLIQCQVNEDCVRSICNLQLRSLSFTYTEEWRSYFRKNTQNTLPCLQTLTKLVIETSYLLDIYANVLQHCIELQHLKIFKDGIKPQLYERAPEPSKFPSQFSSLLKLTNLEITIDDVNCERDVCAFLKAILKYKVIPLNNVEFGLNTRYLLKNGILNHTLILPNRSKFTLRGYSDGDSIHQKYEDYENPLPNLCLKLVYDNVETEFVQNLKFENFNSFADKIEPASRKAIKRVFIRDSLINGNYFLGMGLLTNRCSQITVLHILQDGKGYGELFDDLIDNECVLKSIIYLKNLKELVLSASYLHCRYTTHDYETKRLTIMPFWKVTQSCQKLSEIRLKAHARTRYTPTIHVDSIKAIAHCKDLRVLELSDFKMVGSNINPLSDITKNCSKLEQLSMGPIEVCKHRSSDYILGNILNHAKELKILSIYQDKSYMTETFLNGLGTCEKLENVTFTLYGYGESLLKRDVGKLVKVLRKLKNLFVVGVGIIGPEPVVRGQLRSLFVEIMEERPAFCGFV